MTTTATLRVPWKGVFTALVTPFREDHTLDEEGLAKLVQRQVDAGIQGLVPCGTTGENPALTTEEWEKVIEVTVQTAAGNAWVVAGTGTNNTYASVERTLRAREIGADGALVITPYYNKPTPEGLLLHFSSIAREVCGFPIMVYNVPGRTAYNLPESVYDQLVSIPEVAALKEASGDLAQVWQACRNHGAVTPVFSGEDAINLPIWEVGGAGAVSVLSNVVPHLVVEQYQAHQTGNRERALELHDQLAGLAGALFVETSPAPAKFALGLMDLPAGDVRPPLSPLRPASREHVARVLSVLTGEEYRVE